MSAESGRHSVEAMERQLEAEFLSETLDVMNSLDVLLENIRSHQAAPDEALATIRRAYVNLEARAQTVEQPLIRMVCHRATEYVFDLRDPEDRHYADLQSFVDRIRQIIEGGADAGGDAAPQLARELPSRSAADFNIKDIVQRNVEAMLVIPDRAMGRLIERELTACGYRVSNARTPFRALEIAVRTQPDFIIISAVLDELSGIDLANALVAMPATQKLPTAILTSFGWGHPSLDDLPVRVAIIRKGPEFGGDLAEFLGRFGIT
jgi:hypothetical protein